MATDRRRLLQLLGAASASALLAPPARAAPPARLYLSARADGAGRHRASGFAARGGREFDLPLPGRGHSFAVRPGGREAVLFSRRPGRFALAIDIVRGDVAAGFAPPAGRHFYGHGAFGPGGRLLYATENDFEGERGVVGVYDAARGYRRAGELPSRGAGPHDIRLLSDGVVLAVANGGILTRPDLPRIKLNLPTMSPSLCYIDRRDGRLLGEHRLDPALHRLSIRHLAVGADDVVAVAMQQEGAAGKTLPLVALHRRGHGRGRLRLLDAPPGLWRAMRRYCGGACFDPGGRTVAASAPRGGLIAFWDAASGAHLSSVRLADGCGVAPGARPGEFVASSGTGVVVEIDAGTGSARPFRTGFPGTGSWDNHLVAAAA